MYPKVEENIILKLVDFFLEKIQELELLLPIKKYNKINKNKNLINPIKNVIKLNK